MSWWGVLWFAMYTIIALCWWFTMFYSGVNTLAFGVVSIAFAAMILISSIWGNKIMCDPSEIEYQRGGP